MSIENTPEPSSEQSARIEARRVESLEVLQISLLRGLRCSSGMATLEESAPTARELAYTEHALMHAVSTIQWALMHDAADLIDVALLAEIEGGMPVQPKEWTSGAEQWETVQGVVTSTTVSLLEMLASEFRELGDKALAEDPDNR